MRWLVGIVMVLAVVDAHADTAKCDKAYDAKGNLVALSARHMVLE
jgi:hypothetical protein